MDHLPGEELLKRIRELEALLLQLHQRISQVKHCRKGRDGTTAGSSKLSLPLVKHGRRLTSAWSTFSEKQCLNILESLGQSVHVLDHDCRIIWWGKTAENLFGYSAEEALGQKVTYLLTQPRHHAWGTRVIQQTAVGESWTGQFPVKNKRGENFLIVITLAPFYDDNNTLVGAAVVACDAREFQRERIVMKGRHDAEQDSSLSLFRVETTEHDCHRQKPLRVTIASKICNLASKVSKKVKSGILKGETIIDGHDGDEDVIHFSPGYLGADQRLDANSGGASIHRDVSLSTIGVFFGRPWNDSSDEIKEKPARRKIFSKAEDLMGEKRKSWLWEANQGDWSEGKTSQFVWPRLHHVEENQSSHMYSANVKPENRMLASNNNKTSDSVLDFFNVESRSSASVSGSTNSGAAKLNLGTDSLDYEILWEDLTIGQQIGLGSCGIVYHATWCGLVFSALEYSEEVIDSFNQEVSLMKGLRHPNVLLFMGATTSPQRLCIITEFLRRGCLFRLLQKFGPKLDWKRRIHMALDVARGMNYLHRFSPPNVHRDLKSSNLLVDRNWTVKVADFGLSRLKYETYLRTRSGKGTPQWMAPEVLRNELADEKSDIYSFGVILWELATDKIPWEGLGAMQVVGVVGFMNKRLEIPRGVDQQWASMIESCWHSDPNCRPTFD